MYELRDAEGRFEARSGTRSSAHRRSRSRRHLGATVNRADGESEGAYVAEAKRLVSTSRSRYGTADLGRFGRPDRFDARLAQAHRLGVPVVDAAIALQIDGDGGNGFYLDSLLDHRRYALGAPVPVELRGKIAEKPPWLADFYGDFATERVAPRSARRGRRGNRAGPVSSGDPAVRYAHRVLAEMDRLSVQSYREGYGDGDASKVPPDMGLIHDRNWQMINAHEKLVRKSRQERRSPKKTAKWIYEKG